MMDRRCALKGCIAFALVGSVRSIECNEPTSGQQVDAWMTAWLQRKTLSGRLRLDRFVEPVYFLLDTTAWMPDPSHPKMRAVTVPKGFVTDFASIPREFWSLLRPDGEYAHAAIVHDYLYWQQGTSREYADSVFLAAMEDLKVQPTTRTLLYKAVRGFGASAWEENARLRSAGERRILTTFPTDPTTRWEDWKHRPGVFD